MRALPASFDVRVGGSAAEFVDQQAAIGSRLALAIALLVSLTLTVLWLMTGSVVLPVKAVLMNALTVGAALAPLDAHLPGRPPDRAAGVHARTAASSRATSWSPRRSSSRSPRTTACSCSAGSRRSATAAPASARPWRCGLARTGRVVTAAAILLAVAIGVFSTSSISFIQQIGVATATGVLIDAFVVRTFLVPSLMALLGRWNWWSPRPLRRLHARIGRARGLACRSRADHVRRARTPQPPSDGSSPGRRWCCCRRC